MIARPQIIGAVEATPPPARDDLARPLVLRPATYRDLLPPLSSEEFDALRADIHANGVRVPVLVDEDDAVLDGYHRLKIEPKAPRRVVRGLSVGEKEAFVFRSNFARRNLSEEQKGAVLKRMKATASVLNEEGKTQQQIGHLLGVARRTVSDWFTKTTPDGGSAKGLRHRDRRVKLSHDDKQEIVKQAGRAVPQARIAADFKVSQQRVSTIVKVATNRAARRHAIATTASRAAVGGPANKIIEGDSLVLLKELDEKFDLLIADPPYNVLDVPWDKIGDRKTYLTFMKRWIGLATARLRAKHHAFVFCSPKYVADLEVLLRDDLGIAVQSRIVWHHKNHSMGRVAGRGLVNNWDAVLHFGTYALHLPEEWGSERFDVQEFAVPQSNFVDAKVHQTQKPLDLIKWLVRIGSAEGQTVLDPFGGGGTTAVACRALKRGCVTIEREPSFVAVMKERLA